MLTIVIPTLNRPSFLLRLLRYYAKQGLDYQIVVADSSQLDKQIPLLTIEALVKEGLNLEYRQISNDILYVEKLLGVLSDVKTKYVALGADDDFFVPGTLADAIAFLNAHPEYSAFHGKAVAFSVHEASRTNKIVSTIKYPQRGVEGPTGVERLIDSMSNYTTTWYSVHRTDLLYSNLKMISDVTDDYLLLEMALSNLDVIQGRIKKTNRLFMARQRDAHKDYTIPTTTFDWMISPGWSDQFNRIRSCLAAQLIKQDRIEGQDASFVVRDVYLNHLAPYIIKTKPIIEMYSHSSVKNTNFKNMLKRILGVGRIRNMLRLLLDVISGVRSIRYLTKDSDFLQDINYRSDWMPIFRAITHELGENSNRHASENDH